MSSYSLDVLARLPGVVPPASVARAEAWDGGCTPAEPAASASVVLLREVPGGLETYLLHRHARMPFAASMAVFPGGRVDPADARSGGDPVRVCALRETREETGVVLAEETLRDWAHWTTPEIEPRRYDTHFFVAALPADQEARDISGETDAAAWWSPGAAVDAVAHGQIATLPPTLSILLELADLTSLAEVVDLAEHRVIQPVLPRLTRCDGGWRYEYPARTAPTSGVSR